MAETHKSYAEAFLHNFDNAKDLAEKRCKGLEKVYELFAQRVDCELKYSHLLKTIGSTKHTLSQG